ncbi:MAG: M15 family metallopeptidase [Bacteroidota bacterium]
MKIKSLSVYLLLACLFLASFPSCDNTRQENDQLYVISDVATYHELVKRDSANQLVNVESLIPDIVLDIRYATTNNFTGKKIYNSPAAFVRKPVADALIKIQQELSNESLGLKVFDAYRPYAATVQFYEVYPDTNFVAAPWKGSVHNRGCAVDVTLIDLTTKQDLEMPTPFDDFSEKAAHTYNDLPEYILSNRQILKDVMIKYGFTPYEFEWWHYDFRGWEKYDLMDISFNELNN